MNISFIGTWFADFLPLLFFFFFFLSPVIAGSVGDILTFEGVLEPLLVNPLIYKWWNLYLLPVALTFMLLLCCCLDGNQVLMAFCLNSKMAGCLVIHMLVLWWHLSKCALCILVHTLWEISIQPQTERDVSNFLTGTLVQKQREHWAREWRRFSVPPGIINLGHLVLKKQKIQHRREKPRQPGGIFIIAWLVPAFNFIWN